MPELSPLAYARQQLSQRNNEKKVKRLLRSEYRRLSSRDVAAVVKKAVQLRDDQAARRNVAPHQPPQDHINPAAASSQARVEDYPIDDAWAALSMIAGELRGRWRNNDLGEWGYWEATGPGKKKVDYTNRKSIAAVRSQGGSGRYLLHPPHFRQFIASRGFDEVRVMADLADRGIVETDSDHRTRLVRIDGVVTRMVILPDKFVVSRNSWKLGRQGKVRTPRPRVVSP